MKQKLTILSALFATVCLYGQQTDTITFFSQAFQKERTVYVQTPEFYKYQSDSVHLPVIYILDGQHEWFVNPVKNTIHYLQYTHEIPQALVVIIPHDDRNAECSIKDIHGEILPLHQFITEDVNKVLKSYRPNDYRIIIGHSFSASFALYSHLKNMEFYSAVMAHTPLDSFEKIVTELQKNNKTGSRKIFVSVGGIARDKDFYHRRAFDQLKQKYPAFFSSIHIFEANQSAHNAVPIVATPLLLTKIFEDFSSRYTKIAEVNDEYKLVKSPESTQDEVNKIKLASIIGHFTYSPEIPDINGMASRYLASGLTEYGIAVYEMGVKFFPKYYEFHLALYELHLPTNRTKAKYHLDTAATLLETLENDLSDKQDLLDEISRQRQINAW